MEEENHLSFKKMNQIIITGGMGFFIALIFRYIGWTLYPFLINRELQKLVVLNNGTEAMHAFYSPQPGILEIYIFNITNPEEFSEGGIATVKEVGPYVYEQIKNKVDIEFTEEDTVSYRTKKKIYFNSNKSGTLTESDMVIVLNAPLLVMAYLFENEYPEKMASFNSEIQQIFPNKQGLCINVQIKDLLFDGIRIFCEHQSGQAEDICDVIKRKSIPSFRQILDSEDLAFSYFYNYNISQSKVYKIKRGNENMFEVGFIVEYDNQAFLSMWPNNSDCSDLKKTTDWEFLPPPQDSENIFIYFPETCLSMAAIDYDEEKLGMEVCYYVSKFNFCEDVFKFLCKEYGSNKTMLCEKSGIIDIERCTGEPFLISFPHATYSVHINDVIGYKKQNYDDHYSTIHLQRRSGFPVSLHKKLQTNILLRRLDDLTILKNISEKMIPLVWFEEKTDEKRRYPQVDKVNILAEKEKRIMTICGIVVAFGIILLLVAYFMHSTSQKKRKIYPNKHSFRPTIFEQEMMTRIEGLY